MAPPQYSRRQICSVTQDGRLWHAIHFLDGQWQPFFDDVKAQESNDPGPFIAVSCNLAYPSDLHVCSITQDGKLWHTIRFSDGHWQKSFGSVEARESNDPGPFIAVSCAPRVDFGNIQFCGLTQDGRLWDTSRFSDGTWQPYFEDLTAQISSNPGPFIAFGMGV